MRHTIGAKVDRLTYAAFSDVCDQLGTNANQLIKTFIDRVVADPRVAEGLIAGETLHFEHRVEVYLYEILRNTIYANSFAANGLSALGAVQDHLRETSQAEGASSVDSKNPEVPLYDEAVVLAGRAFDQTFQKIEALSPLNPDSGARSRPSAARARSRHPRSDGAR